MAYTWRLPHRTLTIDRPLVMGIVNVTPDSFSDGGHYFSDDTAVERALDLVRQGADILDIGGESTRPGAGSIAAEEELRRVGSVVARVAKEVAVPISIDTSKASVAHACLDSGAQIINDVTALRGDPEMLDIAVKAKAGVVLMHMQGTPATMQAAPCYADVVEAIGEFFQERLTACRDGGLADEQLALDPGIGFGKTATHNKQILAELARFQRFDRPICVGISRKGFIGRLLGERPIERRLGGSLAGLCYLFAQRTVQIVRVHDVEATCDAIKIFAALRQYTDS